MKLNIYESQRWKNEWMKQQDGGIGLEEPLNNIAVFGKKFAFD